MSGQESAPLWELPQPASKQRTSSRSAGSRQRGTRRPAASKPIARVLVDISLAHLDRTFDYQVPERFDASAVPGCRVRVRFAGQLVDGFLLERVSTTDHSGKLAFLERVTSSEVVLGPDLLAVCRRVAQRYGGSLIDVVRLAIPPRHAKSEAESVDGPAAGVGAPSTTGWSRYPRAAAFTDALAAGGAANAVWQALPGEDWSARLAEVCAVVAASGRGAVLVVPDHRDLSQLHEACARVLGEDAVVALYADLGPAQRYRRWLAVSRGAVRVVVGTRSAMFAPVENPGLFVVWDDGDDLHVDPHMPYPQVRDVLMLRAHMGQASLLVAGFARTAEAQLLLESGWAHRIVAARADVRASAPRVSPIGDDFDMARDEAARAARLPALAFAAARQALRDDTPVLVQVPRRGYVPALACGQCRNPARCRRCSGPLKLASADARGSAGSPRCRWCGVVETGYRCTACGSARLRAVVIGAKRTAEELGRAFPGVPVRTSGAAEVLTSVPGDAALVVCTPGAEPIAEGGFGAALLLDGWALLGRQDLRAGEETLRRWMAAATLVRAAGEGGQVVVGADGGLVPVQALVRWDPGWHADLELAERRELGFPPAARMASVEGAPDGVAGLLEEIELPPSGEVLGPVPLGDVDAQGQAERERALLRVPRAHGRSLAEATHQASARRSARKEPEAVRIQLDPMRMI